MTRTDGRRSSRWRLPLLLLGGLLAALAVPVAVVATTAPPMDAPPPPDRALVVPLPDGGETTLGELLDGTVPPPTSPRRELEIRRPDGTTFVTSVRLPATHDLLTVGMHHGWRGRFELAEQCLSRVPPGDPRFAEAQRFLALRVHARSGNPARGVAHANAALAAEPFTGNCWQDAARVYLSVFGLDTQ